ncbi:MAG: LicD family protein [Bacteroidaceae bacterium]|nr:LicD family protein [Bacteroidaceae bacterium]
MRKIEIEDLKRLELDILDFFVGVCERNGLIYFLSGGTLLGAIRHNGFIPWDDDIDVMMPREDYEKLIKVFPEHEYYKFLYHGNKHNYPTVFGTINDTRTEKPELNVREKCRHILGVNIDVFPIDTLPNNKQDIHNYYQELAKMAQKVYCVTYSYVPNKSVGFTIKKFLGIFGYRCLELLGLISIDGIMKKYDALVQKYKGEMSHMCGVTATNNYGEREVNIRADYYPPQKVTFEGKEYDAPANYDAYLRGLYGNYMQLPPKEKQVPHHANCYWKDSIQKQNI